jgi:cell division transport system permease protein
VSRYFRRALQDIVNHRFLNGITVLTIALSVLIISAFALFYINVIDLMGAWRQGMRIMAYLAPGVTPQQAARLEERIGRINGVTHVVFISKSEALERLKQRMTHQRSLFAGLAENPLPDAFEIRLNAMGAAEGYPERLARELAAMAEVDDVEYGQRWIGRVMQIFNLFRLAGAALGGLFFMASVFILANTIRLVLYSRREEVHIMRLVGATDGFIKFPFYVEGFILGALGGIIGLGALFVVYWTFTSNVAPELVQGVFKIRFLPIWVMGAIVCCSTFVGWLGCYISLRQFFKG